MAEKNELVKTLLRGIIVSCGEEGATIGEIEKEYKNIMSKNWPLLNATAEEKSQYLQAISGVSLVRMKGKDLYVISIEPKTPVELPNIQISEISSNPISTASASPNVEKNCDVSEKKHATSSEETRNILNPLATPYEGHSPPLHHSDYSNENELFNNNQRPYHPMKKPRITYDNPIPMHLYNGINWNGMDPHTMPVGNEDYVLSTFNNMAITNGNYMDNYPNNHPNNHPGFYQNGYPGNHPNGGYSGYQGYSIIQPPANWPGITTSSGVETGYTVESSSAANSIRSNAPPNQQYPYGVQQLPQIQPFLTVIPMNARSVENKIISAHPKSAIVNELCEIMGDDLMLDMVKSMLGCIEDIHLKPKRCGLTASCQTISIAVNKLKLNMPITKPYVIIYLGTIDILENYELMDMKFNYEVLINSLLAKGHLPIIATITPLPAGTRRQNQMIHAFNRFLYERFSNEYSVIDLSYQLINDRGFPLLECFKPYKTTIGRKQLELVLWNRAGRQRILRHIKRVVASIMD